MRKNNGNRKYLLQVLLIKQYYFVFKTAPQQGIWSTSI